MSNRNRPNALKQNLCEVERPGSLISRRKAMAALGQVVYALRLGDGTIKIGCTSNLAGRIDNLGTTERCDPELLGFLPGDFDDEARIHADLVAHRVKRREFYNPQPEVLAVVNAMRECLNLPHIAA